MIDLIYTIKEAASVLSTSSQTLRKKVSDKEIRGYKKLGKWYLLHSDLVEYIRS